MIYRIKERRPLGRNLPIGTIVNLNPSHLGHSGITKFYLINFKTKKSVPINSTGHNEEPYVVQQLEPLDFQEYFDDL